MKAIVRALSTSEMPPGNLIDFFVSLISDENYFHAAYLWKCESDHLDFNR
jgi:hypothetical protein